MKEVPGFPKNTDIRGLKFDSFSTIPDIYRVVTGIKFYYKCHPTGSAKGT
jgi:hypothetical protein